jgi:hypothetical protein
MTYRVIVEPTAEREIRSAVSWMIENASLAVTARWYNGLLKKIDTLRRHPARCHLAAHRILMAPHRPPVPAWLKPGTQTDRGSPAAIASPIVPQASSKPSMA